MAASAPAEATDDGELLRLLDRYGQAEYEMGAANHLGRPGAFRRGQDALTAIKAHIAATYVRREQPPKPMNDRHWQMFQARRSGKTYRAIGDDFGVTPDAVRKVCVRVGRALARDANRLPPSPPGSYREARGVVPWNPGNESPENAIRRVRDGA